MGLTSTSTNTRWLPRQRSMASMSSGPACPNSVLSPDDTVRLLQESESSRTGISFYQDHRPQGASDSPPPRDTGTRPHLLVHARLLRRAGTCVKHGVHCSSATRTKKPRKRGTRLLPLSAPRLPCERYAPRNSTTAPRPHSFQTLLKALRTIVLNICRAPGDNPDAPHSRSSRHPTLSSNAPTTFSKLSSA